MSLPSTLQLGTWLSSGSPVVAELIGLCGFPWVLIDLEHGSDTEAALPHLLRALKGSPTRGIVRVGAPHPDQIARALDWGAGGIMVPHVNSAAEAEKIVQAAHYAPRGHRGLSRTVRACQYGLSSPDGNPAPLLMAQIETVAGVLAVEEIAAVDGIDVLFVGPADLQFDLKHRGTTATGDYQACLSKVLAAADSAGKSAGILIRDLSELEAHAGLGFTYIAADSDIAILRKAYLNAVAKLPS